MMMSTGKRRKRLTGPADAVPMILATRAVASELRGNPVSLPTDVNDLQLLAEYHTAHRFLRRTGWGCIVGGILNIGLAVGFSFTFGPINLVLVGSGLFMAGAGLWCLLAPGAEGIILNGAGLVLMGLLNIAISLLNVVVGRVAQGWFVVFGLVLIVLAVQCFKKYPRFSAALRHRECKEDVEAMDRLVKHIRRSNAKVDEDIILITVRTFGQQREWRGQLRDNAAVFVEKFTKEVLVALPGELRIEPHGQVPIGRQLKAAVRLKDKKWEALIMPQSFERYRDWKFPEVEDNYRRPNEREPEPDLRVTDKRDEPPTGIVDGQG